MGSKESAKKFPIELLCLSLLEERDMYGYEILQEFKTRSRGRIVINIPTLYMALKRLFERGYVSTYYSDSEEDASRGRPRLYYHLEAPGAAYREKLLADYHEMVLGVREFFRHRKEEEEKHD